MWYEKYIKSKFEIKGRGPDTFDCWGLLQYAFQHDHPQKIILPGYEELYEDTNDRDTLSRVIFQQRQARWVEVTDPQPWDAILVSMRGVPMHVGIVTKRGMMLHCAHGVGTAHEKYNGTRWRNKILGFFRYE